MCFPSSRCRLICSMSVTADRARGFLSAAGEQSNTPELPRSKWKLKDSIIIPNRWRANPPTHRIDDQTGDTLVYLKKKKDGPCLGGREGRNGRKCTSLPNEETIGPTQSLQILQVTSRVLFPRPTLLLTPSSLMSRDPLGPLNLFHLFIFTLICCGPHGQGLGFIHQPQFAECGYKFGTLIFLSLPPRYLGHCTTQDSGFYRHLSDQTAANAGLH